MGNYRVILEVEVDANTPMGAAINVQDRLQDPNADWQYYVQHSKSQRIYSVDLGQQEEDAVQEIDNYIPLIN